MYVFRTNACSTVASLSGLDDLVQDSEQGEVRMWFPSMSIFSHSCSPNTEALARTKHGLALSATRVSRVMMMMMMMMMMMLMMMMMMAYSQNCYGGFC